MSNLFSFIAGFLVGQLTLLVVVFFWFMAKGAKQADEEARKQFEAERKDQP